MKKIALIIVAVLAFACTEKNKEAAPPTGGEVTEDTPVAAPPQDSIVTGSVTNNAGITLKQTYNITKNTATFELNGERIEAKRDTVASGIQYSNAHYKYHEHRGDISLHKDGQLVWDNIR